MKRDLRTMTAAIAAVAIALLLAGCELEPGSVGETGPDGPYEVVCTVGMITDIVRQVAGDRAEVQGIMKEGVDPHLYKPARSDVVMLTNADVIFYNGLLLEGKMQDVLIRLARSGQRVYAVTEMLDDEQIFTDDQGHYDPHVWMDVQRWILAVRVVAEALAEYDTPYADHYRGSAEAYIAELQELDAYARRVIATIPEPQRVLVTAHDAFSYFGRAYDIEVRGIQGVSTESEAGIRDINDLVDYIVEQRIPAVFVETSVADKNVRALVEGARAQGHEVRIGGSLFSDAMGKPGTYEGTYIGMIDHNVTTIARALGGKAPAEGMQGKLGTE